MKNNGQISFLDFVNKYKRIRIPRIQRDYAQGRTNDKVNEIRKLFVLSLMRVAKGTSNQQELDFIYGSNVNSPQGIAYEPLDGQQRLTTLFLLHWMFGSSQLCCDDMQHSVLTYETRITAQEFCDELIKHSACDYIKEANSKGNLKPSDVIKAKGWFKWSWKFDPTIQSMLVMIDAIYEEMTDITDVYACLPRLNNITFKERDLEDLGATDELFVKMNARGKQLSEFDILKSVLEEELQIQRTEIKRNGSYYASDEDEKQWRSKMDGEWIDLFWNKYAKDIIMELSNKEEGNLFDDTNDEIKKQKVHAATLTEVKFRRLLLRLIALQLFESGNTTTRLREACYQLDENELNNIIYAYQDQMIKSRRDNMKEDLFETESARIDFSKLMLDMENLVYKDDDGIVKDVTGLLDPSARIDANGLQDETILDSYLVERLQNYVNLIFYSILIYLRVVPQYTQDSGMAWIDNLNEWTKVMRNILHNDNLNNLIGKIDLVERAFEGLKTLTNDFENYINQEKLDLFDDSFVVRKFFASLSFAEKKEGYTGLDNAALNEEIKKSQLKLSSERWVNSINIAEVNTYLWGQIRCVLDWADDNVDLFNAYVEKISELLDYTAMNDANKLDYYIGILSVVPDAWKSHNGLYLFNKVRDNSIKRCLRNKDEKDHCFGQQQKELIDVWMNQYKNYSVSEFLETIRTKALQTATGWRKCVLEMPSLLDYSWHKRIFIDSNSGHVVFAQLKTTDSHCIDPILKFIDKLFYGKDSSHFNDSKSATPHSVEIIDGDNKIIIKWNEEPGYYSVVRGELSEESISEDRLVDYAFSLQLKSY